MAGESLEARISRRLRGAARVGAGAGLFATDPAWLPDEAAGLDAAWPRLAELRSELEAARAAYDVSREPVTAAVAVLEDLESTRAAVARLRAAGQDVEIPTRAQAESELQDALLVAGYAEEEFAGVVAAVWVEVTGHLADLEAALEGPREDAAEARRVAAEALARAVTLEARCAAFDRWRAGLVGEQLRWPWATTVDWIERAGERQERADLLAAQRFDPEQIEEWVA